jgi:hypothetical protein
MDKETSDAIAKFGWAVGISAFGGLVSYLQRFSGDASAKWSWIIVITKVLTAGFVGLLTDWLLSGWSLPQGFVNFSLGVAGYGGAETIVFFQRVFQEAVRRAAGQAPDDVAKS